MVNAAGAFRDVDEVLVTIEIEDSASILLKTVSIHELRQCHLASTIQVGKMGITDCLDLLV